MIFEKLNSRMRVRKEKKQNQLDGAAFAIVLMRAEHVGTTVFHMQL